MTFLDSLEFIFRRALVAEAVATWIWMTVCMLIMVFGLGLVWGKMWNREWGLFNHIGQAFLTVLLALLVGYGVLNWRLASKTEEWIQRNRESTIQSITNSSSFNRQVLSEAWKQLQPMGGQQDLLPPPEGGDEIRINAAPDALARIFHT
jgi:hypothetical protein